ncbi:hypothetical protein LSAT2_026388 [Lamellibrachia satsuma]|nr:hypothetical protein LSAT2_026388 [Lamellibrachia satsuma]
MKSLFVRFTAGIFIVMLLAVSASRSPAVPTAKTTDLEKQCKKVCRPFFLKCLKELCAPLKSKDNDKHRWCIGGCKSRQLNPIVKRRIFSRKFEVKTLRWRRLEDGSSLLLKGVGRNVKEPGGGHVPGAIV